MAKSKKQRRNEKGDGTFRQRPNGTFEYRIVYVDEYGKTKRKSFYGQSDVLCIEKAEAFLYDLEKQKTGININATICDILKNKYFIDLEKNFVHEQGYSRNMANLRIIEKSFIGKLPIRYLTELQVDMFLRSITHYSNSTISKVYLQLKLAFREAFNQHITDENIMLSSSLKCPKSNKLLSKIQRNWESHTLLVGM